MKKVIALVASLGLFITLTGCKKKKITEFRYDGKGYMKRAVLVRKESGEEFGDVSREDFVYNENGLLLYDLCYWSWDGEKFEIDEKNVYEYNSNNQLIRVTTYEPDVKKEELVPAKKYEYTYSSNNQISKEYYHYSGADFYIASKHERVYDSNNNLITDTYYSHSSGSMLFEHKTEYTYNSSNQLIKEEDFEPGFNGDTELFKLCLINYSYDASGNKILEEYEDYKDESYKYKKEFEYNSNNQVVKEQTYYIEEAGSTNYVLGSKEEYTYDASNNILMYKEEILDEESKTFYLKKKEEYTYDTNNRLTKMKDFTNYDKLLSGHSVTLTYDYEYIYYD